MSVTGAARGTSQRRLFYRCGASIYRGRGRLGAVRSVCRTAGLGVGRAIVCSHPGRVLLHGGVARSIVGAPPRCEAKSNQYTEPVRSHPGRVLLQGGGDAFDCRSTASVRSEVKPIHRARPVRTRGGCSYLLSVAGQTTIEALFINGVLAVEFAGPAAFGVGLEAAFEIFREIFQATGVALAFRYGVGRHRLDEVCLLVFPQAGKEVDDTDYNGRPYQPADDSAAKGLFRFFLGDSALVNTIHDILHCSYCWSS